MYNFNDVMVCAEPYVNLKCAGMIVGILPYDLREMRDRGREILIGKCLHSEMFEILISKDKRLNEFHNNIRSYYYRRIFYYSGCTFFAIESSSLEYFDNPFDKIITWKEAAEKYIRTIKFNRACNRLCNKRRFKSELDEYDFLVNAIELGGIDAIAMIAEMHHSDLMIQAFYRAALERNAKSTMRKCIAPIYKHVIDIRCKLVQRWGINENILEVFDRPVVSLNSFKEFSIEPKNTPVFNGFTAKDVLK